MEREFMEEIRKIKAKLQKLRNEYTITSKVGVADYFCSHGYKVQRANQYYRIYNI